MKAPRPDRSGTHRHVFDANKAKIYATQDVCGICGRPVDKTLKWPDPMSKCIDHIIPVDKGGHPSDISNLQLAHVACNRAKSDKLYKASVQKTSVPVVINNQDLPLSVDWSQV